MPWTFWVSFMVLVTFGFAFQPQRYPNNMEIPFNPNQQRILLSSGIPPPFIGNLPSGMTPSRQNMNSRNLPQQQLNQGRQLPQNSIQSNQQLIYEVREEDEDRIPSPIDMLFPGLFNDHEDVEWKDWSKCTCIFYLQVYRYTQGQIQKLWGSMVLFPHFCPNFAEY